MNRQIDRTHIFAAAFFVVFIFLLYQALRLLAPFSSSLLWAAIIALAMHPLYRKALRLLRGKATLTAIIMTLMAIVLVIGPMVFLFTALTAQAVELYKWVAQFVQSGKWLEVWKGLKASFLGDILSHAYVEQLDLRGLILSGLTDFSAKSAAQLGGVLKNALLLLINFFIMVISLFFFFRDGDLYYGTALEILPFTEGQKASITKKLSGTFSAVINGIFLVALLQGIVTGIGFAIFGIPFYVLWGFLAFILALLPVVGAAAVWLPGAIYLLLTGQTLYGILLAIWGLLLVSTPDNFLKPILIGKQAKLPVFFLFIGILGGIKVYGVLGILFGPLIVTLVMVFIQIYRVEYGNSTGAQQEGPNAQT